MTRLRSALLTGMAVMAFALPAKGWASPKGIQEILMGSEIQGLIIGNTLTGETVKHGAFSYFYNKDGTIRGADYQGTWTIKDNALCLKSAGDETTPRCWKFGRDGDGFQLILNGNVVGTGSVVRGNPNDL
jgi:hypothetical protein